MKNQWDSKWGIAKYLPMSQDESTERWMNSIHVILFAYINRVIKCTQKLNWIEFLTLYAGCTAIQHTISVYDYFIEKFQMGMHEFDLYLNNISVYREKNTVSLGIN